MDRMLRKFGLDNFVIKLNSLGCKKDKIEYSRKLGEYLKGEKAALCEDCGQRIKKNVLRVLDCKKESCAAVLRDAPDIAASLCPSCTSSLDTVKDVLKKLGIDYRQTKNLVRGLDYYTGTVFEVTHPALGAQDALGAGGRYDNLVSELGGPDTGAVGYAIGMERLIIALGDKKISGPQPRVVYLATLGNEAKVEGLRLSEEIRDSINGRDKVNVIVLVDSDESSLKSQMRQADKNGAALVIIIGEDELRQGKVVIRDMATKEQSLIDKGAVAGEIRKKLC